MIVLVSRNIVLTSCVSSLCFCVYGSSGDKTDGIPLFILHLTYTLHQSVQYSVIYIFAVGLLLMLCVSCIIVVCIIFIHVL